MHSRAKGHAHSGVWPPHVKPVRVRELLSVPVGRAIHDRHPGPFGQPDTVYPGVLFDRPEQTLDRGFDPHRFFNEVGDQGRVCRHQVQLSRVLEQQGQAATQQIDRGIVAPQQDNVDHADQLFGRQ